MDMNYIKRIKNKIVNIFLFIYEIDKTTFVSLALSVILSGFVVLPSLYFPKRILDELAEGKNYENMIKYALVFIGCSFVFGVLEQMVASKLEKKTKILEYEGVIRLFRKIADMDYAMIQNADTMDHFAKATKCVMAQNFYQLMISLTKFFSSIWVLIVVTSTLLMLDVKILLIVGAVILVNAYSNAKMNKIRYRIDGELWPLDRRMTWFMRFAGDLKYAKDVRSNEAQDFLFTKYRKLSFKFYKLQNRIIDSERNVKLINIVLTSIQELLVYFMLGYQIIVKKIFTVGDFSIVFNAMNAFKSGCSGIIDGFIEIQNRGEYFEQYLSFINLPSHFHEGKKRKYKLSSKDSFVIEFKNVSFRYANQEKEALSNVNVKIHSDEKISIIGENGAGKTTFIKLLLRLYDPTQGAIYLNGINIREIAYEDYCRIFATVFQDFNLFALTLKENLTLGNEEISEEMIEKTAGKIGFLHFADGLPKKWDTMLYSDFDKEGVDLSGGELQKAAILRALLRSSNIVIMDEPTAALDPQAEYNVYKMIDEFSSNKLMIYISHRLASSRFCDKILLFENGVIAEEGSHQSLMEGNTRYKELFRLQAQYYEDAEIEKISEKG